jgi:hypothetical protein
VLATDVLKREVVESEEAKQAAAYLKRAARSAIRVKAKAAEEDHEKSASSPDEGIARSDARSGTLENQ